MSPMRNSHLHKSSYSYVVPTERQEYTSILNSIAWVQSDGKTNTDWYLYPITANSSKKTRR